LLAMSSDCEVRSSALEELRDMANKCEVKSLGISSHMQLPICFLRIGLSCLMGRTASIADLVFFLLMVGDGAIEKLMMAATRAGSDGTTAVESVKVLLATFGASFRCRAHIASEDLSDLTMRDPYGIAGLRYGFPAYTLGPDGALYRDGRRFQWGGARKGSNYDAARQDRPVHDVTAGVEWQDVVIGSDAPARPDQGTVAVEVVHELSGLRGPPPDFRQETRCNGDASPRIARACAPLPPHSTVAVEVVHELIGRRGPHSDLRQETRCNGDASPIPA
ncbi:unnamed protein product, partial [Closterium sp. Naga37s-1]